MHGAGKISSVLRDGKMAEKKVDSDFDHAKQLPTLEWPGLLYTLSWSEVISH